MSGREALRLILGVGAIGTRHVSTGYLHRAVQDSWRPDNQSAGSLSTGN